jgi:hypothetical protein
MLSMTSRMAATLVVGHPATRGVQMGPSYWSEHTEHDEADSDSLGTTVKCRFRGGSDTNDK